MFKYIPLTFLFSFILVGCGTAPKYDKLEVKEGQIVYQKVPDELTKPCTPSKKPPVKEEFLKLQPHEREAVLAEYTNTLLGNLKDCNTRIVNIRKLPAGNETK